LTPRPGARPVPNLAADDPTRIVVPRSPPRRTTRDLYHRENSPRSDFPHAAPHPSPESFDNCESRDYVLRKRKPDIWLRDSCVFARWSVAKIPGPNDFERSSRLARAGVVLLAAAALLLLPARPLVAQGSPSVTAVDPDSGKINDTITISGQNLEKTHVSAVFLSDDKDDYKAVVVSQAADKITIKVPEVKPGGYNVSIQAGNAIFIQPVRFTVQ
jgi:hypothetical protein